MEEQPNLDDLYQWIDQWAVNCNLINEGSVKAQSLKLMEEFGELAGALLRGKDVQDHAGDMFVVLVILSRLANTSLLESVQLSCSHYTHDTGATLDGLYQWLDQQAVSSQLFKNQDQMTQCLLLIEEFGKLAGAFLRGKDMQPHIGEMFVELILLTRMAGTTLPESVLTAWDEIKDRKGVMLDGAFIKSTDPAYAQALKTIEARELTIV